MNLKLSKSVLCLFVCLVCLSVNAKDKEEDENKGPGSVYYYNRRFTEVNIPGSFDSVDYKKSFAVPRKVFYDKIGAYYLAKSPDENYLVLAWFQPVEIIADSIENNENIVAKLIIAMAECEGKEIRPLAPRNAAHMIRIESDLGQTLGKASLEVMGADYKDCVHYFSDEYARSKFNADSAAIYSYCPQEEKIFKAYYAAPETLELISDKDYIGSKVYMIQKMETGFVLIYCFYTEEGKCRIDETMKEIEGIVRFKD